jgi:hypothetical protein
MMGVFGWSRVLDGKRQGDISHGTIESYHSEAAHQKLLKKLKEQILKDARKRWIIRVWSCS